MKKKYGVLLLTLFLPLQSAWSLEMASITWKEFSRRSDFIAEAALVRAEASGQNFTYTFRINETFKGPKLETVCIKGNAYYHGYEIKPGDSCFIALKKTRGNWEFAVMGRSCWVVKYELRPDISTVKRVDIDDFLIRDFPKTMKKRYTLKTLLINGKYHTYTAKIYLLEDIRTFLREKLH